MSDTRDTKYLHGSASAAATLTGSYVYSNAIEVSSEYQLALDVAYTMGSAESGNSVELKVQYEGADGEYYDLITTSPSSGTVTISLAEYTFSAVSAAGTYDRFHLSIPVDGLKIRVGIKETGIAANGGSITVIGVFTTDY